jgi:hypothetical protein
MDKMQRVSVMGLELTRCRSRRIHAAIWLPADAKQQMSGFQARR